MPGGRKAVRRMVRLRLRHEALLMLEGRGQILETAREVPAVLRECGVKGAVIGGVAVVLRGYVRTTSDVDVYVVDAQTAGAALRSSGFAFRRSDRSFLREEVPVHRVTEAQCGAPSQPYESIDGVVTVSLADLVNMKLRSGTRKASRAIDLADVVGLIRSRRLTSAFARNLDRELRSDFRRLVKAVAEDS